MLTESTPFRADELLALSNEILAQVAAYGVWMYIRKGAYCQNREGNEFILHNIFLNDRHENPGKIFRSVCKLVAGIRDAVDVDLLVPFVDGSELNRDLVGLCDFRNRLLHGFFIQPASRNIQMGEHIDKILENLASTGMFSCTDDLHFWNNDGFTGTWGIRDRSDWEKFDSRLSFCTMMRKAASEIYHHEDCDSSGPNPVFESDLELLTRVKGPKCEGGTKSHPKDRVLQPILSRVVWFHPDDKARQFEYYKRCVSTLSNDPDILLLEYDIDNEGIGYTSYLLLRRLHALLGGDILKKDIKESVRKRRSIEKRNVVILLNNIHVAPYDQGHLTSLLPFLKSIEVHFIGLGWQYELHRTLLIDFVDERMDMDTIPDEDSMRILFDNHRRYRGPMKGGKEYESLIEVMAAICDKLRCGKPVVARRFSDETGWDIELIHEAFSILYPRFRYKGDEMEFKRDETHALYGYPVMRTEATSIFLSLGRRDVKLEYRHKTLDP